MGTYMVPISLNSPVYNNNSSNTQRVESPEYSNDIRLVHYYLFRKGTNDPELMLDPLAVTNCQDNDFENAGIMFSEMMQNSKLFNEVTNSLVAKYQEKTH